MAAQTPLVLAVADHDLNRPLIDGAVRPDGLALEVVWDLDDGVRHRRVQREGAFDACELSFGNYLAVPLRPPAGRHPAPPDHRGAISARNAHGARRVISSESVARRQDEPAGRGRARGAGHN
ncbi:MAG TPA: hypothetical protein VFE37_06235 [Chloroflexota bacterium]|nr:hypothetical protein [Chloroflexota bacterium]